jgi:hypothetical protein
LIRLDGTYQFAWPEAASNPPGELDELGDLFDDLAHSAAIGSFAARAGIPAGATLVDEVSSFVDEHLGSVGGESAGVLGSVASQAAEAVERRTGVILRTLEENPTLVRTLAAAAVATTLGTAWLSARGQQDKAALDAHTATVAEVASHVPPAEALKILAGSSPSSGPSFGTVLAIGGLVVAAAVAWRVLR